MKTNSIYVLAPSLEPNQNIVDMTFSILISSGLVTFIHSKLLINLSTIKTVVDTALFVVSYKVQSCGY